MSDARADGEPLARTYPRLFHVTDSGNAAGILRHGLRSTHEVLDLFAADATVRHEALQATRRRSIPLAHPEHGTASIRDQLPLHVGRLATALTDMSVQEWLALLNSLVFFWPTQQRVDRLLEADAYAERDHDVLTIDTAMLVERHGPDMLLTRLNTGATRPFAHARGSDTFLPLGEYPLEERLQRRGRLDAVAEVTVRDGVLDIDDMVVRVERWHGPRAEEVLLDREA